MQLDGKNIAILIAPRGTEEPEFAKPRDAVTAAGGAITVIGLETGEAQSVNNASIPARASPSTRRSATSRRATSTG